jgi:hypothetical protein
LVIPPGPEGVTVARGINGLDNWVCPEDMLLSLPGISIEPVVILSTPLLSPILSDVEWFNISFSLDGPQLVFGLGVSCLISFGCFKEDLDEQAVVCPIDMEDVELAVLTWALLSDELGSFFEGEDRQDDIGGGASIDQSLMVEVLASLMHVR